MGWGEAAETTTTTQIFVIPFHARATRHFMEERKNRRAFWCKKVSGICKILPFLSTHSHTHTYLQSSQRKYFLLFFFWKKVSAKTNFSHKHTGISFPSRVWLRLCASERWFFGFGIEKKFLRAFSAFSSLVWDGWCMCWAHWIFPLARWLCNCVVNRKRKGSWDTAPCDVFFFCESYTASTDKYTTYGKLLFRCGANSILSLVLSRACFAFLFSDFVNRKNSCFFLFFRKRKRLFKTFLRLITLRQVNQRYVDVVCAREKFCDTFEAKIKSSGKVPKWRWQS